MTEIEILNIVLKYERILYVYLLNKYKIGPAIEIAEVADHINIKVYSNASTFVTSKADPKKVIFKALDILYQTKNKIRDITIFKKHEDLFRTYSEEDAVRLIMADIVDESVLYQIAGVDMLVLGINKSQVAIEVLKYNSILLKREKIKSLNL